MKTKAHRVGQFGWKADVCPHKIGCSCVAENGDLFCKGLKLNLLYNGVERDENGDFWINCKTEEELQHDR
jgi:hypothetical protein